MKPDHEKIQLIRESKKVTPIDDVRFERPLLAAASFVAACGLPIVVTLLWMSLHGNSVTPGHGFGGFAIHALILFLVLIFVIPVTTVLSVITAVTAYRQSRKTARYVALSSLIVTLLGLIILIWFIAALQS